MQNKQYVSTLITFFIVAILLISGPAQAVSLSITGIPSQATVGDKISFTFRIDIEPGERIPIEQINLTVDNTECAYYLNGTPVFGQACEGFTLAPAEQAPYTYGYGYGYDSQVQYYGYGYGYGHENGTTHISYSVTWDTASYQAGVHTIQMSAIANSSQEFHEYLSGQKTITLAARGGTASGSAVSQASTTTIMIKQCPRLEVRSIIFPRIMHPLAEEDAVVIIKNTGDILYGVQVKMDVFGQMHEQMQDIEPGRESVYTFSIVPLVDDTGEHIANIVIQSDGKLIEREVSFTVKEEDRGEDEDDVLPDEMFFDYDESTGVLILSGCLEETVLDLQAVIDGKTKIDFRQDENRCFGIRMSTAMLESGEHTLAISGGDGIIYEQTFTVAEKGEPKDVSPTGGAVRSYSGSRGAKILTGAAVLLMLVVLAWYGARFLKKAQEQ